MCAQSAKHENKLPCPELETFKIDVSYVSEGHIQDPKSVITSQPRCNLTGTSFFEYPLIRLRLLVVKLVFRSLWTRGWSVHYYTISVNSTLCAVQLGGFVRVNDSRLKRRCLFVILMNGPTDCSSLATNNEFHQELSQLLHSGRPTDVVCSCLI